MGMPGRTEKDFYEHSPQHALLLSGVRVWAGGAEMKKQDRNYTAIHQNRTGAEEHNAFDSYFQRIVRL